MRPKTAAPPNRPNQADQDKPTQARENAPPRQPPPGEPNPPTTTGQTNPPRRQPKSQPPAAHEAPSNQAGKATLPQGVVSGLPPAPLWVGECWGERGLAPGSGVKPPGLAPSGQAVDAQGARQGQGKAESGRQEHDVRRPRTATPGATGAQQKEGTGSRTQEAAPCSRKPETNPTHKPANSHAIPREVSNWFCAVHLRVASENQARAQGIAAGSSGNIRKRQGKREDTKIV